MSALLIRIAVRLPTNCWSPPPGVQLAPYTSPLLGGEMTMDPSRCVVLVPVNDYIEPGCAEVWQNSSGSAIPSGVYTVVPQSTRHEVKSPQMPWRQVSMS